MSELTMGSLFDGIGVFPLAASRHGIVPVWASEIVPDVISITKRHFPEMVHLGDITALSGGKIPAVDVITFGSPCQNYAEEMIIPKYAAKYLLLHGFVQKLRDNKFFSVSLRV